jgi:ribose 1,5-bisphosphate isomerase
LRNALRFIVFKARKSSLEKPKELAELVSKTAAEYKRHSLENKEKIAEYGSNLVRDGGSVLVHCHSGTVMRVLKRARDKKKDFRVFCCETRPLYQGRISARELSDYGIETTLIVDSAASSTMKKMSDEDIVLVGCDAITAQGDLVNKIGTFQIALAASALDKNLYSCTGLHKFEPLTLSGIPEPIEERSLEEVLPEKERKKWGKKSRKFANVINPAFDLTPSNLIKAFVTEYGVVPPASLVAFAEKEGLLEY